MNVNELSVLSLNCWGLFLVSKEREFRLRAIADAISHSKYDIVTLQEIWMWNDFEYLKTKVQSMLPFSQYFYSGALGSGLAILSRYPIVSTSYFRYTLAGRPLKIFHGDFYVGKGCASACIDHPEAGLIEVFTTHLHANYGDINEYEGHRVSECWELAGRLRASAAQGRQIIVTGDFNSIPTSYNYELLKSHAFVTDSWLEIHKNDIQNDPVDMQDADVIQRFGITCDSPHNSWTIRKLKQEAYAKTIGDRLDYIFYRRTPQLSCIQSRVVLTECIPGTQMSYSDHFGVHSVFAVYTESSAPAMASGDFAPQAQQLMDPRFSKLNLSVIHEILELLQRDHVATRKTANSLLASFVFSVFVVIALCATIAIPAIWPVDQRSGFMPLFVVILAELLLVMMAVVAVICLIVGFVFGRTEQKALRQFISEVETLLASLQPESPPSRHDSISSDTSLLAQNDRLGW